MSRAHAQNRERRTGSSRTSTLLVEPTLEVAVGPDPRRSRGLESALYEHHRRAELDHIARHERSALAFAELAIAHARAVGAAEVLDGQLRTDAKHCMTSRDAGQIDPHVTTRRAADRRF